MDYTVHGILQARILEWVAFPSPGDLPNPGIEPRFPTLQVDSLPAKPQGKPTTFLELSTHMRALRACVLSHVGLIMTPWTLARQAPLSMEFSWQE